MQVHDRVGTIDYLVVCRAEKIIVILDIACLLLSIMKRAGSRGHPQCL